MFQNIDSNYIQSAISFLYLCMNMGSLEIVVLNYMPHAACHNKYKIYPGGTSIVHVHYNIPLPILASIV